MFDVGSVVGWWDNWQLRILVLGSVGIQWFLLVAAPMRKYAIWRWFRLCIWLAYISSDALAIYALATLFNRHARAATSSSSKATASTLEVLWAPVLLIHLGGQEALMAYTIEDTDLWIRHTVTLVSQVAIALYAFYKSWHSPRDWKLLASEILFFIIGVVSCCEKPWALKKASINSTLASLSATIQGTKKRSTTRLAVYLGELLFSGRYSCFISFFTEWSKKRPGDDDEEEEDNMGLGLSERDKVKVYIVLSDMSLSAAADDLVRRGVATSVRDVLRPLSTKPNEAKRWLDGAFGLIYTRASLVSTRTYLVYHVLVVPILHIVALTLFVTSDKDDVQHKYNRTDVKITYILLCLTAALDVFAVFVRQLVYWAMSAKNVPALCETVPGYNLMDAVLRRRHEDIWWWWLLKCATSMGCSCKQQEGYFECCNKCKGGDGQNYILYKSVSEVVLADLVDAEGRDLASYRVFTVPYDAPGELPAVAGVENEIMQQQQQQHSSSAAMAAAANWTLSEELQRVCGPNIRRTLRGSFDRSVLVWHIATDLCFRMEGSPPANNQNQEGSLYWLRIKCTEAISSYMARLLNSHPDMLLTGSRQHLVSEAMDEFESILRRTMVDDSGKPLDREDLTKIIDHWEEARFHSKDIDIGYEDLQYREVPIAGRKADFHIPEACSLAKELLALEASTRWSVMYRVWLGMLFYSASMCRGYLHAKSLGEGGEFLSYIWLVLSLKGAKTLADKLQMPEGDEDP